MRRDAEQAVADLRGEIAAAPDPAQNNAQIGAASARTAMPAALDRSGAEQPMRERVEFRGDPFEDVGDAVDNRLDQPGEGFGQRCPAPLRRRWRKRSAPRTAP